jgi:hypothetical protein
MTISTFVYFNENINTDEEELILLDNEIDLSDFYLEPPESVVQKTIQAILMR